jgi:hypothetical protein
MLVFRWQFHTFIPRVSLGLIKPSISLLNSTLPWSQVSQVDELSALLSKKQPHREVNQQLRLAQQPPTWLTLRLVRRENGPTLKGASCTLCEKFE